VFHLGRFWRVRTWRIRIRAWLTAKQCDKGYCVATEVQQFLNKTVQTQDYVFVHCLLIVPSPNSLTWLLLTSQYPGRDVTTRRETARRSQRSVLLHRALCQSASSLKPSPLQDPRYEED